MGTAKRIIEQCKWTKKMVRLSASKRNTHSNFILPQEPEINFIVSSLFSSAIPFAEDPSQLPPKDGAQQQQQGAKGQFQ